MYILLLPDDINVSPFPTTLYNNKILFKYPSILYCNEPAMPPDCDSSDCYNEHDDSKWKI